MKTKRQSTNSSLSYLILIALVIIVFLLVNKKENTSIQYNVCHNLKEKIFTLDKSTYIAKDSLFNHINLDYFKKKYELNGCGGNLIKYSSDIKHLKKLRLTFKTRKRCPGIHYKSVFNIIFREEIPLV